MIINRVSDTDSSKYLDDKGLAELVTQIKTYADTHSGGSVTVETLKQATVDVSDYNAANKPIVNPTSPNDAMAQVEITLSNIPVPTDVEATKQATIDVATYDPLNMPVITPTYPKEAMARVEVALSNVPSIEANKQVNINVATYDPLNKPVIHPTYPNDAIREAEVTLDNIPTIEASKQATVDISTYDPLNKPVIVPTSPNDGMGEVVVTLSNIPGSNINLYYWTIRDQDNHVGGMYINSNTAPVDSAAFLATKVLTGGHNSVYFGEFADGIDSRTFSNFYNAGSFTRISDTQFTFSYITSDSPDPHVITATRNTYGDVTLTW